MNYKLKMLIILTSSFLFTIGCVGIPLDPKSVNDIQSEKYFYKVQDYQSSIMQLVGIFQKYKSRCGGPAKVNNAMIERDSNNTAFFIIGDGDVLLYAQFNESNGKTVVRTWTVAPRIAEWFYLVLDNVNPCIESVWDDRIKPIR